MHNAVVPMKQTHSDVPRSRAAAFACALFDADLTFGALDAAGDLNTSDADTSVATVATSVAATNETDGEGVDKGAGVRPPSGGGSGGGGWGVALPVSGLHRLDLLS